MIPESIGARLRRLRRDADLSQRELESPGVSYAYISRVENGDRTPSGKALRILAERLGVSALYLETGQEVECPHCLRGSFNDELIFQVLALRHDLSRIPVDAAAWEMAEELRRLAVETAGDTIQTAPYPARAAATDQRGAQDNGSNRST